jgi:hypothetical protein
MKRFFDGTDQVNSKTQGGKGEIRKIQTNKKERMEERKRRDLFLFIFYIRGGSHTRVFSISRERPWAIALVQPSLRRTHSYRNLPYNLSSFPAIPCHPWVERKFNF